MKTREVIKMIKDDIAEQDNLIFAHRTRLVMLQGILNKIEGKKKKKGVKDAILQPRTKVSDKSCSNVEYTGLVEN